MMTTDHTTTATATSSAGTAPAPAPAPAPVPAPVPASAPAPGSFATRVEAKALREAEERQRRAKFRMAIPTTDAGRLDWMRNLAHCLREDHDRYHTLPGEANEIAELVDRYHEHYRRASCNATRTPIAIAEKNEALAAALKICRLHARRLKADPRISPPDKLTLGFKPARRPRRPPRITRAW